MLEITDAEWEQGPTVVNPKIRAILDRFRDQRHAAVVAAVDAHEPTLSRTAWRETGAPPPPRSDNNPPEPIEDSAIIAEADLSTLKRKPETRAEAETWARTAEGAKRGLAAILGWTGEKLDVFMTEAAKEAGKQVGGWGVRLAALGIAGNLLDAAVGLAEIVDAARAFLATWGVPL